MQSRKQDLADELQRIEALEQRLTFRLHVLSKQIDQQASALLEGSALNLSAYRFLTTVESLGDSSIADIARFMAMDRALASRTASDLERRGLIGFDKAPDNRRKKLVRMTPEGQALLDQMMPRFEARRQRLRDRLGPDRFAVLNECLDLLQEAIRE
ncbi:MarR family transcriptional regulator [Pseudooceanicola sp. CBS1P-1]|uniref:MarR family transcriptional regulator n=1 Tax=Pseudooceanicola albus TaxID=2692189 RepID=A0A6L7G5Y7_9RHOB|nr:MULTISPECIES: MarR family transcriptional regulator [Pseudooceanicola]MBT9385391.1 MarR family transcriptional regulator [Pseudooceanicola endophyticus]MXN18750.1 MarR family transcriptional regulator [Pseudooceanicola albus]